ncbi:MAG: META domain-containing protein [Anaerolineales bacterium]|nr:META domain-containing protein [Anaerolineales bacterium]
MNSRINYLWTLLLCAVFLTAACQPTTTPPPANNITPAAEQAVGPHIRVQNNTDTDLEMVTLNFGPQGLGFNDVAAGGQTNFAVIEQAYQAVEVTAQTAAGETYIHEPLDGAGEIDNPITAGTYTIILSLHNGRLQVDWQPEMSAALQPLLDTLTAAGVDYSYQPSIKRRIVFNELLGDDVGFREILQIGANQLDVYLFDTAEIAQEAASTIQYGGTAFKYTRDNGETISIIADMAIGTTIYYWHYENYILHTTNSEVADTITAALNTQPLYDLAAGPPLQVAIANVSHQTYDNLAVTLFDGMTIGSGDMPAGSVMGFNSVEEAYRLASVSVTLDGQTHEQQVIDYVGETPLPDGRYIYAVDVVDGQIKLATIREDELLIDETLIDKRWQWVSATPAAGEPFTPESVDQQPYLQFTTNPEPNNQGGYVVTGYSGCNGFGGSYFLSLQQQIVISNLAMTQQGCIETIQQAEQFLVNALQGITAYQLTEETLTLTTAAGDSLTFNQVPDPMASTPLKGYQIFSWLEGNEWRFALLAGTNRLKEVEEVQVAPLMLDELIGQLQTLEPGTEVHWPDTATADILTSGDKGIFALPPQDIIDQVLEAVYAADLPLSIGGYE